MTDFVHKPNSGSLFKNNERETDSHPNAKGSGVFVCPHCQESTDIWLDAWTNTTKSGDKYQSVKFKSKQEAHSQGMAAAKQSTEVVDDDLIPF